MTDLIARQGDLTIGPGTTVTLHFSIHLANGEEGEVDHRGDNPNKSLLCAVAFQ